MSNSNKFSLPNLPNYTISPEKSPSKKKQTLVYKNGYAVFKPNVERLSEGSLKLDTIDPNKTWDPELTYGVKTKDYSYSTTLKPTKKFEDVPLNPTEFVPQPTSHNVLSFEAYFYEDVPNSTVEDKRLRKCNINYFLEDATFLIKEKRTFNSGIPQGVLLKRQKIPKSTDSKQFFTIKDINLGVTVEFYSRQYTITNCDYFTKKYMEETLHIQLNAPIEMPEDPYEKHREKVETPPKNYFVNPWRAQLQKFLQNDGRVMRFYCIWDNRSSMFGDIRKFVLYYFLVDDTIEIREVLRSNSGQLPFATFLKRRKLAKNGTEFVTVADLKVGSTVDIFSRKFFIYDTDKFTKQLLKESYGIEFTPVTIEGVNDNSDSKNKFSTTADDPKGKSPKKNFQKMLDNERKILRFASVLDSPKPEDRDRIFVVSYYLADDTIGIYEPPQRNSGIVGGKFLERRQVQKPDSSEFYEASDFYVGNTIEVFKHKFVLQDADEYAFNYMEANPQQFPMSDLNLIQRNLGDACNDNGIFLKQLFLDVDKNQSGVVSFQDFRSVLSNNFSISEQELITLIRKYDTENTGSIAYNDFVAAVQK